MTDRQGAVWGLDFLELGTSTVYEASGLACAMDAGIRPAWARARLCGTAFTVRCVPGDNLVIHQALDHVTPGEVLVVQAGGTMFGYWGEVLTRAALARGVAGLVIDGGLRDVDALESLAFPAFSRGASMLGTTKRFPGELGVALTVGGVLVSRGSLVLADRDGVLALPRERIEPTLRAARERRAKELAIIERIGAGESTLDLYGLRRAGAAAPGVDGDGDAAGTATDHPAVLGHGRLDPQPNPDPTRRSARWADGE
jgi:4-hydroxy-4-methyl-2-oxoglutarate aldolase